VEHTETQVEGQKEGSTRRHFLKQAGLLGAAVAVGNFAAIGTGAFAATGGETVASIIAAHSRLNDWRQHSTTPDCTRQ
jgi:nitrous oxide reductase